MQGAHQSESRRKLIVCRWLDLVAYGAFAGIAVHWIWPALHLEPPFLRIDIDAVSAQLGSIPEVLLYGTLGALLALLAWRAGRGRWRAFLGVRHPIAAPSLAWSITVGFLTLWLCSSSPDSAWSTFAHACSQSVRAPWWCWVALLVPMAGLVALTFKRRPPREWLIADEDGNINLEEPLTLARIREWVRTDEPTNKDLFGHDAVARRIVHRLENDFSTTLAVVGPLGSGKSTIGRLVEAHLLGSERIELVAVSLWPFDSPEAAVAGILRALIEAIGKHAATLPLSGLPGEYARIIERAAGRWGVLGDLLRGPTEPWKLLARLERLAHAVDVRFILWIEDLERFAGTERLQGEEARLREADRLNPIRALLYELAECHSIAVIVADTSLQTRFDLEKIARYIERPPRFERSAVGRIVSQVRKECLAGYPCPFINPATEDQEDSEWDDMHAMMGYLNAAFDEVRRVDDALAILLDTPRMFKNMLRLLVETWAALCGEIDFEDLLLATTLRTACPDLFAFIDDEDNLQLVRNGFEKITGSGMNKEHSAYKELRRLIDGERSARRRQAVEYVVGQLFPNALSEIQVNTNDHVARPQRMASVRHVDYWRRYTAEEIASDEVPDQKVLHEIAAWKAGTENSLLRGLIDGRTAGHTETFVGQFSSDELLRLLKEVVLELKPQSAAAWKGRKEIPGVDCVWQMFHAKRPKSRELADLLVRLLPDVAPVNLPLALAVLYFFTEKGSSVPALVEASHGDEVKAAVRQALMQIATGGGSAVLRAANDGAADVWREAYQLVPPDGGNPDYWSRLAKALVDVATHDADRAAAFIAPLVTTVNHAVDVAMKERVWQAEFVEAVARERFGREFDRMMAALARANMPELSDGPSTQVAATVQAAVEYRRNRRSKRRSATKAKSPGKQNGRNGSTANGQGESPASASPATE